MLTDPAKLRSVLVTDCGSTTTKALLFEKTPEGWRQTRRGEAPTTVEEPVADVTVGVVNAVSEIEEISGRRFLKSESERRPEQCPIVEANGAATDGVDLYISTSSAGGGLQMMVAGIVGQMSTESAERAALGAGAIVLDAVSADDGREDYERIRRIRHLRPDIVLMAGGVEGGARSHAVEMAEVLLAASPRPRFGTTLKLPVIYAGNSAAAEEVKGLLEGMAQVTVVDNLRPSLDRENLGPAREAIHEFFLTHVMSHSPGYGKLLSWTPVPIMPTPAAVGDMVLSYAKRFDAQVLCADIGGATTDVFSVFKNAAREPIFNRTVSANYGMSYSIANVLIDAGTADIARWLPYEIDESELRDRLRNKMIRPTSIPQTVEDLWLEQAVCREALRLSLAHHRSLAVGLSGVQQRRGIADIFSQRASRYELVNLMALDVVIGSGGVLSHAPRRVQAALMMIDGFELQGVTELAVDSIFMMPHLGVFSAVNAEAANEIFLKDCIVRIGHAVVPVWPEKGGDEPVATVAVDGREVGAIVPGEVTRIDLPAGEAQLEVAPLSRHVDVGAGPGTRVVKSITAGSCGLILDGRNRPMRPAVSPAERAQSQRQIFEALRLAGKE